MTALAAVVAAVALFFLAAKLAGFGIQLSALSSQLSGKAVGVAVRRVGK